MDNSTRRTGQSHERCGEAVASFNMTSLVALDPLSDPTMVLDSSWCTMMPMHLSTFMQTEIRHNIPHVKIEPQDH